RISAPNEYTVLKPITSPGEPPGRCDDWCVVNCNGKRDQMLERIWCNYDRFRGDLDGHQNAPAAAWRSIICVLCAKIGAPGSESTAGLEPVEGFPTPV